MEDEEEEEPHSTLTDLDDLDNPMAPAPPPSGSTPTTGVTPAQQPGLGNTVSDVSDASARAKALAGFVGRSLPGVSTSTALVASTEGAKPADERVKQIEAVMSSVRQRVAHALVSGTAAGSSVSAGASGGSLGYVDPATGNYVDEFEINDYPQDARQRITNKVTLSILCALFLVAVSCTVCIYVF